MIKRMKHDSKQTMLILIVLWLATSAIRIAGAHQGQFPFWYDAGRDALVSREILEKPDLKIQGPSASGTKDTIYHGVIYYYLIGPLYTLFHGNPQAVLNVMIAFSSLAIIPIYVLAKELSNSRSTAFISAALYAVSLEGYRAATWLSNPVIATVSLPTFFLLYWYVFFKDRTRFAPAMMLALAITHQATIIFAPLWGLIILGFYLPRSKGHWTPKLLIASLIAYLAGISTMILTQFKLYAAHIFSPAKLPEYASYAGIDIPHILSGTYHLFLNKTIFSLAPTAPLLSLILAGWLIHFLKKHATTPAKTMLIIMLTSPLWLLSWHYRNMYHTAFTLEIAYIIPLSMLLTYLWSKLRYKPIAIAIAVIVVGSQWSMYQRELEARHTEYFVPQGAYLSDMLEAIDYTYTMADGQPFSITTFTNPYRYNTLWAFLYGWHGQQNYGYLPYWYGESQEYILGGDILEPSPEPQALHVSIWEPNNGLPDHLYNDFESEQRFISNDVATEYFGTVRVDIRHVRDQ